MQKGRFPWPSAADGTARLTSAQMAMLWEGIDWRRPNWGAPPARVFYLTESYCFYGNSS
nr:IS66 family insertion sequence element accessory protein TnpB [Sinorhizobium sp. BJ1]